MTANDRGHLGPGAPRPMIRAAAIRDPLTGRVYTGPNHSEAYYGAAWADPYLSARLLEEWEGDTENVGFVTVEGCFLNRVEAKALASVTTRRAGLHTGDMPSLPGGRHEPE